MAGMVNLLVPLPTRLTQVVATALKRAGLEQTLYGRKPSEVVTLELLIGGRRIPLAQVAHNFAIAAEPVEFAPCDAEIIMTIDGQIDRMPVHLPNGCIADNRRFSIGQNTSHVKSK